jgi:hypothetical protein
VRAVPRRLAISVGLALGWYALIFGVLWGAGLLVGARYDLSWLGKSLLSPLSVLSWIAQSILAGIYHADPGHLPHVPILARVAVGIAHFVFVSSIFFVILTWRSSVKSRRQRIAAQPVA